MNSASSTFKIPKRQILTKDDLDKFQESQAYEEYTSFVIRLNDSVKGLKLTTECIVSSALINILEILDTVNTYCSEIPPVSNEKSRFGNPAFKDFYDRVTSTAFELHENLSLPPAAIPEVSKYFVESWGNRKRIDYGTGHEANFIVWLYLDVMRNLQFKYWLEPAGSHGVWGLDDYHFLPFLFGSSQLIGVREWKKVNEGMFKMYKGEVLAKLPIMQHFMFGSLINFEGSSPSLLEGNDDDNEDENGHVHVHAFGQEFPDCCGIKIPSAVGAKQMNIRDGTIKRLPFD
ncbi:29333_t:CDS:2 [Gigaspora margarita]|uniref:Serine/threonine-protein phosphatase 2A activator n=1 Tax=Gigaspora margarita TaxID=4874 RepID=A0ABN7UH03_GIGMA|nr:29333_t:CDS:2 [Gigaspora margarita]